jgi:hypothetical protein
MLHSPNFVFRTIYIVTPVWFCNGVNKKRLAFAALMLLVFAGLLWFVVFLSAFRAIPHV